MLWTKIFFSIITKKSNEEILTKNVVTFKKFDGVKDEKLWCFGYSLKNLTFRGGSLQKTDIEGGLPKKGGLDSLEI